MDYRSRLEKEIRENGKIVIKAEGISMKPFIRPQSDVLIIEELKRPVKKNDIVLFYYNDKVILHRVIRVNDGCIDTRGDHNIKAERNVKDTDIFGILKTIKRGECSINPNSKKYVIAAEVWSCFIPFRYLIIVLKRGLNERNQNKKGQH